MAIAVFIVSLFAGIAAAMAAGALSGVKIGGEHIGNELAAYMGSLYGFLSGTAAVAVGLIVLLML